MILQENGKVVINTFTTEDLYLSRQMDIHYDYKTLKEIVSAIFAGRNTPLNILLPKIHSDGYVFINESDIDTITLWLKQVFRQRGKEL